MVVIKNKKSTDKLERTQKEIRINIVNGLDPGVSVVHLV